MPEALLAEVVRSGFVESRHHGAVVVLGADGAVLAAAGDVIGAIFPRSANKPMQALGMLRSGLALSDPGDLAVVCASHSAEPAHVDRITRMLGAAGLAEERLACPPDLPIGEQARLDWIRAGRPPARIAMNCSGKHTGMLLTCLAAGWPLEGYRSPDHPLQRRLSSTVEDLIGAPVPAVGVDGCGAPVFAMSLTALAAAFRRLVESASGTAERRVADAMREHPQLVGGGGAEREDTRLMSGVPGLLAKGGAEGVMACAVPGVGAVAVKIGDGSKRAIGPVTVAALRRLGLRAPVLDELAETPVLGGGAPVGGVRTCVSLE